MTKQILLNDQVVRLSENDLPLLIHGKDSTGASLFTITVISNFVSQGSKILFFSAYPMAKDEFRSQIGDYDHSKIEIVQQSSEKDLLNAIADLKDIDERIILLKNAELLTEKSFNTIKSREKIILSGDLQKSVFNKELFSLPFKTTIFFSQLEGCVTPSLHRYEGYMKGSESGYVRVANM